MAANPPLETVKLGSMSLGVNNRLPPTQLGRTLPDRSPATYLSAGDNVDLTGRGYLRRRAGSTLQQAGVAAHSVWGDGDEGYMAVGNTLVHLEGVGDSLLSTVVISGLPELARISYERMPDGDVAWSNGFTIGRLRGSVARPLVTLRPSVVPAITLTSGALPEGRYQMAFTAIANGIESGSTTPIQIDVPENGGIAMAGLSPGVRVYMTGPNGAVFNHIEVVDEIVTLTNTGTELRSLMLADMPPGQVVRWYRGSLLVANGPALCLSEPYVPGLMNASKGYILFPAPITVVEPCEGGVFVCADRTYWLAGALLDAQPVVVLQYGGLLGSGSRMPTNDGDASGQRVCWLSPRGLVVGGSDGSVAAVQEKALKFGRADSGATLFRERDGANRVIATRQNAARPLTAALAFAPMETIVKDTSL